MTNVEPTMSWEAAVQTLRDDPDAAELVKACFYDDPLIDAATRYWQSTEWAALRAYLPSPTGKALEIGAGRGIASFALASDGWSVTALEPDSSAIVGANAVRDLARSSGRDITVVQEWGETLPFPDAAFDLVFCRAVLHHARDLGELCREVGRVLKPGGRFIAAREHVVSRKQDIAAFQEAHPLHALYGGEYAYLITEYREAIQAAGLTIREQLNPLESDINLFPQTRAGVKATWSAKLGLPIAPLLPNWVLTWRGGRMNAPGRLYTFVANKLARG